MSNSMKIIIKRWSPHNIDTSCLLFSSCKIKIILW